MILKKVMSEISIAQKILGNSSYIPGFTGDIYCK